MSHIPKRAFIIYSPIEPNQPILNVDQVALNGCSGQIALESTPNKNSKDILTQLLGIYNTDTDDFNTRFKKRFNEMSCVILSNSIKTKELAIELDCCYETIESIDQVINHTQDVILIDFTDYPVDQIWSMIDALVSQIDLSSIQCIISPSTTLKLPTDYAAYLPQQTFTKKNGLTVDIADNSLIYAYLHTGSARKDSTKNYSQNEIQENGCNGIILAWHLLSEIGHKLGFVPKYGA